MMRSKSRLFLIFLVVLGLASTLLSWPGAQTASGQTAEKSPADIAATPAAQPAISEPSLLALPDELTQTVVRLAAEIEGAEKTVERIKDREDDLAVQRGQLESLLAATEHTAEALMPRLDAVRSQIEKLGDSPDKEQSPEAPQIAAERARLSTLQSQIDGAIKSTELTGLRARQLVARIQELRHAIFARDLLRRTQSPIDPSTWRQVFAELPQAARQIATISRSWGVLAEHHLFAIAALVLLTAGVHVVLMSRLSRTAHRRLSASDEVRPSFFSRAGVAAWLAPTLALPGATSALLLYGGLQSLNLLTLTVGRFAEASLYGFLAYTAISSLSLAILSPQRPYWRMVDLCDASALRLARLIRASAVVFGIDIVLKDAIRMLYLPLPVGAAQTFLTSLAIAGLLIGMVRTPFAPPQLVEGESGARYRAQWLKPPLVAAALAIIVASVLGYVALGRFIAAQVILVGSGIVVVLLLHLAVRAALRYPTDGSGPAKQMLEARFGLPRERRRQLSRLIVFMIDVGLALIAVPFVLLSWGFSWADLLGAAKATVFGFEVGQVRISLARIVLAALLFLALLFATRLLQRWVAASVLQPARVDPGIAHSIHIGLGYAGVAVAGVVALSYGGLDITNLAIVAGALSVGIGFGLQSIVNNFVSGLILLAERPVKVGDWIVVKGQEGYVRRISVRATEIETFDRASLIIPNSELITGTVTNWTHRNAIGRLIIKVGVSYQADPERVREILMTVAETSEYILKEPAPRVALDDLGPNALDFSLRVFIPDVTRALDVQTELRMAIFKRFQMAGIEFPHAQYDVHFRDLDRLRQALALAFEARRKEKEAECRG
jgi:potassium-dependent mechanosensitive channel